MLPAQPGLQAGPDFLFLSEAESVYLVHFTVLEHYRYAFDRHLQPLQVVDYVAHHPLDAGIILRMLIHISALNEKSHRLLLPLHAGDVLSPAWRPAMRSRQSPAFWC